MSKYSKELFIIKLAWYLCFTTDINNMQKPTYSNTHIDI